MLFRSAATHTPLHLVGPLGFELSDRTLKRAGLDYWPQVNLSLHPDWTTFQQHHQALGGRLLGFTTYGRLSYLEIQYQQDDWLLFGSETSGLPAAVLENCDYALKIPIHRDVVRSLNLSVSVAIGLFEALRQINPVPDPSA